MKKIETRMDMPDQWMKGAAEEIGRLLEERFISFRQPVSVEELQAAIHRSLSPLLAAKDERIAELEGMAENRLKTVNLLLKLNAEFVTIINMLSQTDLPTPEGEETAPCQSGEDTKSAT